MKRLKVEKILARGSDRAASFHSFYEKRTALACEVMTTYSRCARLVTEPSMPGRVSLSLCGVGRDTVGGLQGESLERDVLTVHMIRETPFSRAQTAKCVVKEF